MIWETASSITRNFGGCCGVQKLQIELISTLSFFPLFSPRFRVGQRGAGLSATIARSEHEISEIIDGLSEQEVSLVPVLCCRSTANKSPFTGSARCLVEGLFH